MPAGSHIVLSIFDRLTDNDPRQTREVPQTEWEQMAALKNSVARDLGNLLNTRINRDDIPDEFENVRASIAAYGVEDYTRSPVHEDEIRRSIEYAVRTFEPRLTRVLVEVITQNSRREASFRITASLKADMGGEQVVFDAALPKETRRFGVKEGR